MRHATPVLIALALCGAVSNSANAQSVLVSIPGTASPWLAGMPGGTPGVPYPPPFVGQDSAPQQSPALASGLALAEGRYLTFTTSGLAGHAPGVETGAEGRLAFPISTGQDFGSPNPVIWQEWNGISGARAPLNALMGVFLDDGVPSSGFAPAFLDFENNRNYTALSPLLRQAFFIGDGRTDTDAAQRVNVPAGATRLYLGIMDGFGWADNVGVFQVTVTSVVAQPAAPEPGALGLFLLAAAVLRKVRR